MTEIIFLQELSNSETPPISHVALMLHSLSGTSS